MKNIDSLPTHLRVSHTKGKEEDVLWCLNEHYADQGYNLLPASAHEDCVDKTDCWQVSKKGLLRSAIKVRTSKNDILAAIRDPFYGVNDQGTRVGRDMLYEYFQYITLSKDESVIRVASGRRVHAVFGDMWQEWLEAVDDLDVASPKYRRGSHRILRSEKHPGNELWLHHDSHDGHPKILGFIQPSYLKEGREIKYHPFIKR